MKRRLRDSAQQLGQFAKFRPGAGDMLDGAGLVWRPGPPLGRMHFDEKPAGRVWAPSSGFRLLGTDGAGLRLSFVRRSTRVQLLRC